MKDASQYNGGWNKKSSAQCPLSRAVYLWLSNHFFSSLLGVRLKPDDLTNVLAIDVPTCWNLSCTCVCNRSTALPYESMYFFTEPNSFCSFRNSPALCIVARIFFSF